MQSRQLHRNAISFFLTLISVWGFLGASTAVAVRAESAREKRQIVIAQNDASAEAERLSQEGDRLKQEGSAESLRQAIQIFERARMLFREVGNQRREATTLNNIGRVYSDLGEKQKALDYYNQALPLSRAAGDRAGEANICYNLASLYRQQNQLPQALESINTAISLIEDLRFKIDSYDLRTSYVATVYDYYQVRTDLLMQLKQPQEAFNTNEYSRARTFLDLLTSDRSDPHEGADSQLLEREKILRQQLRNIEVRRAAALSRQYNEEIDRAFDRESDAVLEQLNQLLAQIRRTNPAAAYADLKRRQRLTVPIIQQQVLDPETVLLQYSLGEPHSYLWVISSTTFNAYELPGKATLAEPIQRFLEAVATPQNPQSSVKRQGDNLVKLILPSPVWEQIAGKRLLIVGDGDLLTLPFAALPIPNTPKYTPLLKDHEVFDQPSASAIAILRQQTQTRSPAPKTLAILADPVYTTEDSRVTSNASTPLPAEIDSTLHRLNISGLPRLPNTRREAESILTLLPESEYNAVFDFAADRDWATSPQLSQYRILHFATHGFVNPDNPAFSGIILSLVNSQGLPKPGFLRLNDIFNLNLPAELVVLSACETGLGKNVSGEGLIGLTRGFMYAGTKRLIVSLWSVNDEATADLMASMYAKMFRENMTPAAALRAAQLEMWQANKYPNLWAAFTVRGEWKKSE